MNEYIDGMSVPTYLWRSLSLSLVPICFILYFELARRGRGARKKGRKAETKKGSNTIHSAFNSWDSCAHSILLSPAAEAPVICIVGSHKRKGRGKGRGKNHCSSSVSSFPFYFLLFFFSYSLVRTAGRKSRVDISIRRYLRYSLFIENSDILKDRLDPPLFTWGV